MYRIISIDRYRNIGISAHIDAGKTTFTERVLFYTGINRKIGEVHDGLATMDWMKQEQERGITITSASTTCLWNGMYNQYGNPYKINIIDTPGHVDFTLEVERSMRVLDGAIMLYCSVGGVQSQSETVWRQVNKYNIPRIGFINKMDRSGANYLNVINEIKTKLNSNPIILQLNIGEEENFTGIIDIIKMKSIYWENSDFGTKFKIYDNISNEFKNKVSELRNIILETAAESCDELFDKYINTGTLTENEIKKGLRIRTIKNEIFPIMCGSAFKNKCIQPVLDSIVDYLPSPNDLSNIKGVIKNGNKYISIYRKNSDNDHFSALAFKICTDPFVGNLTFIRVYSGKIKSGDIILNYTKNKKEKLGRIVQMHANKKEDIKNVFSGDIVAIIGLKDISTGDTLCSMDYPILLEKIEFPNPVISMSIEPLTKNDQDKMGIVLNKLLQEDPSFKVYIDNDTNQTIISGMGELHLEIIVDRMKREYNLNVNTGIPQVSYKETIKKTSSYEGKYIRQTGGRGQYGHVFIKIEPNKYKDYEFINNIIGGVIPKEFIPSIDKGIQEQMKIGILAGYPIINIKATCYDGSYHEVDSSEIAFKIASSIAFKEAFLRAEPILLEPIMKVFVETPEEYIGDVISDISRKRGIINNMETFNNLRKIISYIPLSEMFGYSTELRSKTKGRACYSMDFYEYKEVPIEISKKIIDSKSKKVN
ncbi:elongation factor G [Candidatus Nardonella dryophthoridicola]|uniref:Elongation factor G n=1 Tax=endosymbiont of Rhynchophorus ferrugineus TaxID=1972133 RepID=A0A2Z5TPE7_9GAMM|nr:elongation factor G [Candidatus Nardonella dryophthoridicola]BBA85089.1 elongation factor G [endosymbiont of Rhynchophorus ferrugineus]